MGENCSKTNLNDNSDKNIKNNNVNGNNYFNNAELNKISGKFPNCFSNINNKIIYSNDENKNDLINKKEQNENDKNNEDIDNNINIKVQNESHEKIYNLSLKANKSELFDKIKKEQDKTLKIKYDTMALNVVNDRVLKTRIQSAKICDVKEIAPKKMDYVQYYIPLSAFDELNYQSYTEKFQKPKPKYNRPRTASEFALRNFKKYENNYLALRQEMTKFYGQDKESMNKMLYEKNNEILPKEKKLVKEASKGLPNLTKGKSAGRVMSAAINVKRDGILINKTFEQMFDRPLEGRPRPMYYLPKPELALFKKPPPIKGKKKKKR